MSGSEDLPQKAFARRYPAPGVLLLPGSANFVLLSVTTDRRQPWLANETAHHLLHETWSEATAWVVGDYLLMPDHLHCFCAPHDPRFSIENWIIYWKREFTRKHRQSAWRFQSQGWHHRLRDGEKYSEKWLYVQENPLRQGLCQRTADWPFKGKVFDIQWAGK